MEASEKGRTILDAVKRLSDVSIFGVHKIMAVLSALLWFSTHFCVP